MKAFGVTVILLAWSLGEVRADWVQRCVNGRCESVWVDPPARMARADFGQAGTFWTEPPPMTVAARMPVADGPTVAMPPMTVAPFQTVEPPMARLFSQERRVGPIRRLLCRFFGRR